MEKGRVVEMGQDEIEVHGMGVDKVGVDKVGSRQS